MPKISIIVPIYKVEKYIDRCIKSILNQTFNDFELILVDDGSPDNCSVICDKYEKIDKRIKVIHKKNEGLSAARNSGIEIAQGEYIAFIDSDDFINKNMFKILYENIKKYDADISICKFKYIYPEDYINENCEIVEDKIKVFSNINALEQIYEKDRLQFIVAWNKLYKKTLFEDLRYDKGKCHEDEFIIHKLLYKSDKVVYCLNEMYYYLQRDGSIMKSEFNAKNLDILDALIERMNFFRVNNFKKLEIETLNNYIYFFFDYYLKVKYKLNDKVKLVHMEKQFSFILKYLLKNPTYNKKAKILWIIFRINPKLYYFVLDKKNKSNSKKVNYIKHYKINI